MTRIWREWLAALACDPEAALAAAHAYRQLPGPAREDWLRALESDAESLGVPKVAVYAPLLAVEGDPVRRARMQAALAGGDGGPSSESRPTARGAQRRALRGGLAEGCQVAVLVEPLYLDFVQVLACAYLPGQRFLWVRHDPIALDEQSLRAGQQFEGVTLERVPQGAMVDDLARTILAHQRGGEPLPEALCSFADLFGLDSVAYAGWCAGDEGPETSSS